MPWILFNIAGTGGGVECLVLTIGYSGGITKGLLNEYFFRDVRQVGKNVIITVNHAVKCGVFSGIKDCFIAFLGFWLINLQNLLIVFLAHVRECLVIRARACFWAYFPMLPSSVIHLSSGGLVGGWYRIMKVIRDGLYYGMCLPVGVMFYGINNFAYKVICG